jgi:hypothetical protein
MNQNIYLPAQIPTKKLITPIQRTTEPRNSKLNERWRIKMNKFAHGGQAKWEKMFYSVGGKANKSQA